METTRGKDSADEISEDIPPAENCADDSLLNRTQNDTNLIMIERLKRKDPIEWNASGSLPEKSEMDLIMQDYLERKEEQEREGFNSFHTD